MILPTGVYRDAHSSSMSSSFRVPRRMPNAIFECKQAKGRMFNWYDKHLRLLVPSVIFRVAPTQEFSLQASRRRCVGPFCWRCQQYGKRRLLLRVEVGLCLDPGAPASQHVKAPLLTGVRGSCRESFFGMARVRGLRRGVALSA